MKALTPPTQAVYKIDKADALWLSYALSQDPKYPQLHYVSVTTTHTHGHTAATTDGYRLHVLEIDQAITDGYYKVDKKTGQLTPADLPDNKHYPDVWAIVPEKYDDVTETLPITLLREDKPAVYELSGSMFSKSYVTQAIPKGCTFRIKTSKPWKNKGFDRLHFRPGLIEIKTNISRLQFAVVMPTN